MKSIRGLSSNNIIMNLAFAGCGRLAQMLITTTGNTGRRIIIPLKAEVLIRISFAQMLSELKVYLERKGYLTENIYQQRVSVRLSVQKRDMSMEPHKG